MCICTIFFVRVLYMCSGMWNIDFKKNTNLPTLFFFLCYANQTIFYFRPYQLIFYAYQDYNSHKVNYTTSICQIAIQQQTLAMQIAIHLFFVETCNGDVNNLIFRCFDQWEHWSRLSLEWIHQSNFLCEVYQSGCCTAPCETWRLLKTGGQSAC